MAGRSVLVTLVIAAALAVPAIAAARPFYGTVGPGVDDHAQACQWHHREPREPGRAQVRHLRPELGHNFHLLGPGVSKKTAIDFIGSRTWKVTLQVGTYKFRCDAHPKTMRGSFNVS